MHARASSPSLSPAAAATGSAPLSAPETLGTADTWRQEVLAAVLDEGQLVRLTLKGRVSGDMPYRQAVVMPVMLKVRSS